MDPQRVSIPPFVLDHAEKCLWHDGQRLALTPKDYAVLACLVGHPNQLVTHDALLRAGWPTEVVEPGVLKVRLRRLRQLLGDTADTPRFIAAVRGHGYRYVGAVGGDTPATAHSLVGRTADLALLRRLLDSAAGGDRQMVFVTGEAGIGKTALLDAFVCTLARETSTGLLTAHGQCIEHHGVGEAYLPVLEALGRLCRGDGGAELIALLRRAAPTWLAQMPALVEDTERESLQFNTLGAAQERMMREMTEVLEAFTVAQPLVLWLEDLQWADYSTLDLVRYLAQRRGLARLLLIATCRSADLEVDHPLLALQQELRLRRQTTEIALGFLSVEEIGAWLLQRFAVAPADGETFFDLARVVHHTTGGNPLYMINMVEDLVSQARLVDVGGRWQIPMPLADLVLSVPDSLRQLLERQFARLSVRDTSVLETASVIGAEFTTAALAAALELDEAQVEACCERLARGGRFLRASSATTLPGGAITGRYRFAHALYQKVLHERQSAARRARLHRRIANWAETVYAARAHEIAAELAMHCELGQDYPRAVHYLAEAAQNALRRSANREAIDLLTKGIALVAQLPDPATRAQAELSMQVTLAVPLMMTRGSTALEVRSAYRRARDLCREIGDTPLLFPVLVGLGRFSYGWELSDDSRALREQLLRIAESAADPAHLLVAHMMLSGNAFFQGHFRRAHDSAGQGLALYDPRQHRTLIYLYGDDPQVLCLCWAALAEWYLGHADRARATIAEALRNAEHLSHPYGIVFAHFWSAFIHQGCGAPQAALDHTTALLALTETHENPQFAAMGRIVAAWALAVGAADPTASAQLRLGLDALRATRQELGRPYFLALLAEVHRDAGRAGDALAVLDEALEIVGNTGERMHEAELHRLRGECLLLADAAHTPEALAQAEAAFERAIAVATGQAARFLALRAQRSLVSLRERQLAQAAPPARAALSARLTAAVATLREQRAWFTEGFDTADLQSVTAVLARRAGVP